VEKKLSFKMADPNIKDRKLTRIVGQEYKPEHFEMFAAVKWFASQNCEPASLLLGQVQSKTQEEYTALACSMIPHILQWGLETQISADNFTKGSIQCLAWVLANYWHSYGLGPKPTETKGVKHHRKTEQEWFLESLHCGLCMKDMPLTERDRKSSMSVLLKKFGLWMQNHAMVCQETISEKATLTKLKQEEERASLKDRKASEYYNALLKMGKPGQEISTYLMSLRADVDKLTSQLKQIAEQTEDKTFFNKRYAELVDRLNSRPAPSTLSGLNFEEKIQLGALYTQRSDLQSKLAISLKPSEAKKLSGQITKLSKEIAKYEKKMSVTYNHEPKPEWSKPEPVATPAPVKNTMVSKLSPVEKADLKKMRTRLLALSIELKKMDKADPEYTVVEKAIDQIELRIAQILR
jgi:hypothetical protein